MAEICGTLHEDLGAFHLLSATLNLYKTVLLTDVEYIYIYIYITRCRQSNISVFINSKLYMNGCYSLSPDSVTCLSVCLSKPGGLKRRKYRSTFSTQLYPISVANLPICCNITLTVMVAIQSNVQNSKLLVATDC
jgi:hypothetical protein